MSFDEGEYAVGYKKINWDNNNGGRWPHTVEDVHQRDLCPWTMAELDANYDIII